MELIVAGKLPCSWLLPIDLCQPMAHKPSNQSINQSTVHTGQCLSWVGCYGIVMMILMILVIVLGFGVWRLPVGGST